MGTVELKTELASGFTVGRYHELKPSLLAQDSASWEEVIAAVVRRIEERYLAPIRDLEQHDALPLRQRPTRAGFAIVALDCLLIDTIQSFREGRSETAEISPSRSFEEFLFAAAFSDFSNRDRGSFFQNVRNALLHNGETRSNWKIRIGTRTMVTREGTTRLLNRRLFHAAVLAEWNSFCALVSSRDELTRIAFLRRLDALSGLGPEWQYYFAYGSNLLAAECARDAKDAVSRGRAFLPRHRVVFTKHSTTRNGDAASLVRDDCSVAWGYVYRVSRADVDALQRREVGYELVHVTVFEDLYPFPKATPIPAITFVAAEQCSKKCGPPAEYLALVIEGARERSLPEYYLAALSEMLGQSRSPAKPSASHVEDKPSHGSNSSTCSQGTRTHS